MGALAADTLQEVWLDYVTPTQCRTAYRDDPKFDPTVMVCAGGAPEGGRDGKLIGPAASWALLQSISVWSHASHSNSLPRRQWWTPH